MGCTLTGLSFSQNKNFLDQPYVEVSGSADTLITPNQIFIRINISEKDSRDKVSIEESENQMVASLRSLGIDIEKDLTTEDISSNFKNYFLKGKEVLKSKQYMLKVKDAVTATNVFIKLEQIGIANSEIDHVDHSDIEMIRNMMRSRAILNAKVRALALTKPLGQTLGAAIHILDVENYNGYQASNNLRIRGISAKVTEQPELQKIDFEKIKVSTNVNAIFILK
ncbi:MAG: hypothetical protein NVSMB45_11060 [Ginsengibacter sp.]